MAYSDEPKWVSGRLGSLTLEPPITHPAFCPCKQCPAYRAKRAARLGLAVEQVIGEPIDIRVKRNSPFPRNRSLSKDAAIKHWCKLVAASTGAVWEFMRVNQSVFDRLTPTRLQDLIPIFAQP